MREECKGCPLADYAGKCHDKRPCYIDDYKVRNKK